MRLCLAMGVGITLITELLGGLSLLSTVPLFLVWTVTAAWLLWRFFRVSLRTPGVIHLRNLSAAWWIVVCFGVGTLLTGLLGAPNAWDSLTYHLPRIERWVEHGHLEFWPTSVDRQLWTAPWSSYAVLQFRFLTGGDRLAFLPSWLAYMGCILLTAQIIRQFGGDMREAGFGALVMATLPMAVLHASSVQSDLPAAFWVLCVVLLVLESWRRDPTIVDSQPVWLGVAVGLAVATKGTALLAVLPWLALYALAVVRDGGWRGLVRPLLLGGCAVLVINGPHFARNVALFGDPLGDPTTRPYLLLSPFSLNGGIANLFANLSLHLGTPWAAWNDWWASSIQAVQSGVLRVRPHDLFPFLGGFQVQAWTTHESVAGSPAHLVLGMLLLAWIGAARRKRRARLLFPAVAAGVGAVVIHLMVIRWQPFGARLQLGALIWLAPVVGLAMRGISARLATAFVVTLTALPGLAANHLRPILGEQSILGMPREQQFFREHPSLLEPLREAAKHLQGADCRSVLLQAGYDAPEYLLQTRYWRARLRELPRHYQPPSVSGVILEPNPVSGSCALIVMHPSPGWELPSSLNPSHIAWSGAGVGYHIAVAGQEILPTIK